MKIKISLSSTMPSTFPPKMVFENVHYDQQKGEGHIAKVEDVMYFGFVGYMTAKNFLNLAEDLAGTEREDAVEFLTDAIKNNQPIASPYLDYDSETKKIMGHEGRHRCTAIINLFGENTIVPVAICPRYLRGRDVTLKLIKDFNAGVKKQSSSKVYKNTLLAACSENLGLVKDL